MSDGITEARRGTYFQDRSTVSQEEKVKKLVGYFNEVCAFCDELDIYERAKMDQSMQEMIEWVDENFKDIT